MADVEDEVFSKMGLLNLDELLNIHGELQLPAITDDAERTPANVRRRIMRFLVSDEVLNSDDQGTAHYLIIKTYLDTQDVRVTRTTDAPVIPNHGAGDGTGALGGPLHAGPGGEPTAAPPAAAPAAPAVPPAAPPVVGNGTVPRTNLAAALAAAAVKVKPDPDLNSTSASSTSVGSTDLRTLTKYLKKDFKIKGTIGLPGEKDRIKFSQLAHAINRGARKGYSEEDIIEEVIRITSPDIPLREMLEGNENLTIAELRKTLRVHFHEKDSSKLWEDLMKATQTASQDATQFVESLISLKQRILFVSKEAGSSVQFSESAVNAQFVRSLLSGLKNNNIRNELKAVVSTDMSQVDLLELLDIAVANEEERLTKWGATPAAKNAVINRVDADSSADNPSGAGSTCTGCCSKPGGIMKPPPRNDHNPILNKLGELQVSVNEVVAFKNKLDNVDTKLDKVEKLEKELADLRRQVGNPKKGKVKFIFGCDDCKAKNISKQCRHCFKCGAEDHKRPDCPN